MDESAASSLRTVSAVSVYAPRPEPFPELSFQAAHFVTGNRRCAPVCNNKLQGLLQGVPLHKVSITNP